MKKRQATLPFAPKIVGRVVTKLEEGAEIESFLLPKEVCMNQKEFDEIWEAGYPLYTTNIIANNAARRRSAQYVEYIEMPYHYGGSARFTGPYEKQKENTVPLHHMKDLPKKLQEIHAWAEEYTGVALDQALLNFYIGKPIPSGIMAHSDNMGPQYRWNGKDYVRDKESKITQLGDVSYNPLVVGVTFGPQMQNWSLDFKKKGGSKVATIPTPNNSVQIQRGLRLQDDYAHEVKPKAKTKGDKLNVTFRSVNPQMTKIHKGIAKKEKLKSGYAEKYQHRSVEDQRKSLKKAHSKIYKSK